jgi:eukaryotic-like serine/threonine-protein kinase
MTEPSLPEESIFAQAVEISSAAERAAFLDRSCGDNQALRATVEGLLLANQRSGDLLDLPEKPAVTTDAPVTESPGTVIGPYKLLEEIGEGGFGVVFMAEQTQPVRRKVAVKVLKPGMDTRQVIARFEAERQALAMMDHVNIARVFDAGATENGRPYFVMELVHGVPITKYCDDNQLTPRERLELFVPVCQAIQHAHQKGIIHRDVKPSNVMITLYDGKPVPKVIDFGVAKATESAGGRLTERTLFTQYGTIVGTLEYMSPEQAEMSALGVDTRSDIYSLGVLLYELLTGSTPLSHKRLKEAAYGEVLRMIREEEPPKPSTRLSDSGEALASISAQRHMEPAKLTKLVRGELDWIVMKALDKDRNRRYATATAFAEDLQRFLADRPIQARRTAVWERTWRWCRRNKVVAALLGGIAAMLLAGAVVSSYFALKASARAKESDENATTATQQAELARRNFRKAREAVERMTKVAEEELADVPRMEELRARLLRDAVGFYLDFLMERSNDPALGEDTGAAYLRLGTLQFTLGAYGEGEEPARKAVALFQQLLAESPGEPRYRHKLADSYAVLARCVLTYGDLDNHRKGTEAFRQAYHLYRELAAEFPDMADYRNSVAYCQRSAAFGLWLQAPPDRPPPQVEKAFREALELYEKLVADHPTVLVYRRELADSYQTLAQLLAETKQYGEAERQFCQALEQYEKLVTEFPRVVRPRAELARTFCFLGGLLTSMGRSQDGGEAYGQAVDRFEKLVAEFPSAPEYPSWLRRAYIGRGAIYNHLGQWGKAVADYARAIELGEKLVAEFPSAPEYPGWLRRAYIGRGAIYNHLGQWGKAVADYARAIELGTTDPNVWLSKATAHANLGVALRQQGKLDDAITQFGKAIELDPKVAEAHAGLGNALKGKGVLDEAIAAYRQAIRVKPDYALAHENLGSALGAKGWDLANRPDPKLRDPKRAVELGKEAVEVAPQSVHAWQYFGWIQYRAGNWKASIDALETSCKLQNPGDCCQWIVMSLAHWKLANEKDLPEQERDRHKAEARRWYDEAVKQINNWGPGGNPIVQATRAFRAEAAELLGVKEKQK